MKEWREKKIKQYILDHFESIDVFAIVKFKLCELPIRNEGIFYKSVWFTPHGVWVSDTGGGYCCTTQWARSIVRSNRLDKIAPEALLKNWVSFGLWDNREFEIQIVKEKMTGAERIVPVYFFNTRPLDEMDKAGCPTN